MARHRRLESARGAPYDVLATSTPLCISRSRPFARTHHAAQESGLFGEMILDSTANPRCLLTKASQRFAGRTPLSASSPELHPRHGPPSGCRSAGAKEQKPHHPPCFALSEKRKLARNFLVTSLTCASLPSHRRVGATGRYPFWLDGRERIGGVADPTSIFLTVALPSAWRGVTKGGGKKKEMLRQMARMPGILQESMALTYAIIPHTPSNGAAGVNAVFQVSRALCQRAVWNCLR